MNKALAVQVHDIAEGVRHWVEKLAYKREQWESHDLNGYCAIASAELHQRLVAAGIRCEMRLACDWSGSHVYVAVEDHIVDVTATQFREFENQAVVIQHEKELEHYWFYRGSRVFTSRAALRKLQLEYRWPPHQIALPR